jgi:hypothetical protein
MPKIKVGKREYIDSPEIGDSAVVIFSNEWFMPIEGVVTDVSYSPTSVFLTVEYPLDTTISSPSQS